MFFTFPLGGQICTIIQEMFIVLQYQIDEDFTFYKKSPWIENKPTFWILTTSNGSLDLTVKIGLQTEFKLNTLYFFFIYEEKFQYDICT